MTHFSTVKRVIALAGAGAMLFSVAACGGGTASGGGKTTLKFAAFEGGYGADMYKEVVAAYEKLNPDVKIELTTSKKIEDEITPGMKAGNYPDIVELGQGSTSGLTETLLKDKAIEDVTDVLDMKVPGENKTVKDKLVDGVIGLYTNPYGGDKTYLMPMYYSPSGLVYNKTLLEQNGWKMPTTWDEMFKLGDEAKAKGISLFTYPTAGYFDAFFNALLADIGGDQFYQDVMTYKKDVWKTDEAKEALETTYKLVTEYLNPDTVGYANAQDFTKNQQSILDGKSLFMPNGTWIVNEMKDAPRTSGFEWGFAPVPTVKNGGTRYINTTIEAVWIPAKAKNKEAAKKFMAYLYSDEAASIFAKTGAIQPIKGNTDDLASDMKVFYDAYNEDNVKAVAGSFSATATVEGKNIKDDLYNAVDSVASGKTTLQQWQDKLNETSNALNAAASSNLAVEQRPEQMVPRSGPSHRCIHRRRAGRRTAPAPLCFSAIQATLFRGNDVFNETYNRPWQDAQPFRHSLLAAHRNPAHHLHLHTHGQRVPHVRIQVERLFGRTDLRGAFELPETVRRSELHPRVPEHCAHPRAGHLRHHAAGHHLRRGAHAEPHHRRLADSLHPLCALGAVHRGGRGHILRHLRSEQRPDQRHPELPAPERAQAGVAGQSGHRHLLHRLRHAMAVLRILHGDVHVVDGGHRPEPVRGGAAGRRQQDSTAVLDHHPIDLGEHPHHAHLLHHQFGEPQLRARHGPDQRRAR